MNQKNVNISVGTNSTLNMGTNITNVTGAVTQVYIFSTSFSSESAKAENENLKTKVDELTEAVTKKEAEAASAAELSQKRILDLEGSAAELSKAKEELEAQAKRSAEENTKLTSEVAELKANIAKVNEESELKYKGLEEKMNKANADLSKYLAESRIQKEQLEGELANSLNSVEEQKKMVASLTSEQGSITEYLQNKIRSLEAEKAADAENAKRIGEEKTVVEAELKTTFEELEKARREHEELQKISKSSEEQKGAKLEKKSVDKRLLAEPSYHGFIPREDLPYVLQQHGDYILRSTEVNGDDKQRKKELVLSVLIDPDRKCSTGPVEIEAKEAMIKNVIVNRQMNGKYAVEPGFRFDTMQMLLRHYSTTPMRVMTSLVNLIRAVRFMRWEFSHKDVSVEKVLGSGAFGEVHKGTVRKRNGKLLPVAIKTLRTNSPTVSKEKILEMMREARLMRNLAHPNVVKIYGVALTEQPLYILLELVSGGGLDSYLKKHADIIDRDEKLQMAMGAVWGLAYLHRSGIIHRDIAARNCLFDEDKNVKISDFGLSRQGTIYKMKTAMKMPIKWMAPESIEKFVFSQKTDVYSCGILIWEIFACKEPFDGLNNSEAKKRINEGKLNEFPENTPKGLVNYVQEKKT